MLGFVLLLCLVKARLRSLLVAPCLTLGFQLRAVSFLTICYRSCVREMLCIMLKQIWIGTKVLISFGFGKLL
jgi:hypothetical protein